MKEDKQKQDFDEADERGEKQKYNKVFDKPSEVGLTETERKRSGER